AAHERARRVHGQDRIGWRSRSLIEMAAGEMERRGLLVDNESELGVVNGVDAVDVVQIELVIRRTVGGRVGEVTYPPSAERFEGVAQLPAPAGEGVHHALTDGAGGPLDGAGRLQLAH